MGALEEDEIDAWLREGGRVITSSERAARALTGVFHRARIREGLKAWNTPDIQDWNSFVRSAWVERSGGERLLLNPIQEQSLWARIAAADESVPALLEGPLFRAASLAMDAHALICSHAPGNLRVNSRAGWQNDPGVFSRWMMAFDEICKSGGMLSPSRLPVELLPLLKNPIEPDIERIRPPLLLAGFDRLLPMHREVFDDGVRGRK